MAKVARRPRRGAQVVCLPELFRSPYFCQKEEHVHLRPGGDRAGAHHRGPGQGRQRARGRGHRLALRAARRRPVPQHRGRSSTPTARSPGLYRKMHIPDDPCFYEKFYFTPGRPRLPRLRHPRRAHRRAHLLGPVVSRGRAPHRPAGRRVLFYPTAIGWHPAEKAEHGPQQRSAWQTIQRSHAIANGVYVAAVNRVGHERPAPAGPAWSSGAPRSWPIPSASWWPRPRPTRKRSWSAEWTSPGMEEVRRNWPFLRDRRIDAYAGIDRQVHRLTRRAALRLPDAGRVGAPRGHLDRLAAQASDWPGKFAPIPWVYARDRAQARPGRDRAHPRRGQEAGRRGEEAS